MPQITLNCSRNRKKREKKRERERERERSSPTKALAPSLRDGAFECELLIICTSHRKILCDIRRERRGRITPKRIFVGFVMRKGANRRFFLFSLKKSSRNLEKIEMNHGSFAAPVPNHAARRPRGAMNYFANYIELYLRNTSESRLDSSSQPYFLRLRNRIALVCACAICCLIVRCLLLAFIRKDWFHEREFRQRVIQHVVIKRWAIINMQRNEFLCFEIAGNPPLVCFVLHRNPFNLNKVDWSY